MPSQSYIELLSAFCTLVGIEDASALIESGNLIVNDVAFALLPPNESDEVTFRILCDFGPVPTKNETKICRRLLEVNLLTCTSSCFVLNPENGHVLLHYDVRLVDGDAKSLLVSLERCAQEAMNWRRTYYMDKADHAGTDGRNQSVRTSLMEQLQKQAENKPTSITGNVI